jgi:hypothetical protein
LRLFPAGLVARDQDPAGVRVIALREVVTDHKDLVRAALLLDIPGEEHIRGEERGGPGSDQKIAARESLELGGMLEKTALGCSGAALGVWLLGSRHTSTVATAEAGYETCGMY